MSIRWNSKEDELLRKLYPSNGSNIVELRGYRTSEAINKRARRLGLNYVSSGGNAGVNRVYTGTPVRYRDTVWPTAKQACEEAGINYGDMMTLVARNKLPVQKVFDSMLDNREIREFRYGCLPVVVRGVLCNTVKEVARAFGASPAALFTYMRRHNCTLEDTIAHYSMKGVSRRAAQYDALLAINRAYVSGEHCYYFVVCSVCKKLLLLPEGCMHQFVHGEECTQREVPDGMALPAWVVGKLSSMGVAHRYLCVW